MRAEDLRSEIVRLLEARADAELVKLAERYHKTSGYKSYGVKTSELRNLIKKYHGVFKQLSADEKLQLAGMFFRSGFSEQEAFGLAVLKVGVREMGAADFGFLDEMAGHLSNWATTDSFCIDIMQPVLKAYPKDALNLLRKWNHSESLWKRRASVVVFTRKIGSSGKFVDEALELCDRLIWDKEDMVRKGVGWALKDSMHGDKKRVLKYVKSLRRKRVPSVITLYATRDLKGKERDEALNVHICS